MCQNSFLFTLLIAIFINVTCNGLQRDYCPGVIECLHLYVIILDVCSMCTCNSGMWPACDRLSLVCVQCSGGDQQRKRERIFFFIKSTGVIPQQLVQEMPFFFFSFFLGLPVAMEDFLLA